jgi:MYXO-CTERM domain-containing protein
MSHKLLLTAAAATAVSLVVPSEAAACGGFFCSTERIDQSKERIVFGIDNEAGQVEAHIQIFYEGSADEFAWVVPVPSAPEFGLSTDELFTQLSWRTAPSFQLEYVEEGDCTYEDMRNVLFGAEDDADFSAVPGADEDGAGGGVVVVDKNTVGPYDQVTLQASDTASLLEWLQANDYDIPNTVGEALAPYVTDGAFFVALKLTSDSDAGDIAPVKMRYDATSAMIPLVLTSIAATPDMRLEPYIFSDVRAVPDNYLHVKINEAAIDWLGWGSNYDKVVTQAADEAGGQAFATDYAGSTAMLQGSLYSEGRFDMDALAQVTDPAEFVQQMLWMGFPRNTAVQNLIRDNIPMPQELVDDGIEEAWFYNCMDCYDWDRDAVDFDPVAFAAELDEVIVGPLREAESLFTHFSYVTRMTSSMSPEEMTLDPYFVLNPDMDEVDNLHRATLVTDCGDGSEWVDAPRYLELDDGRIILVPSESWFWDNQSTYDDFLDDLSTAAALVVEDTSASGQPMLISDQSGLAGDAIDDHNARVRDLLGLADDEPVATGEGVGCGCSSSGPSGGVAWFLGGLLAFGLRRRD